MTTTTTARTVTTPEGECRLIVMDRRESFPTTFALMATTAPHKVALRVSGGCKGMSHQDKLDMLRYFDAAADRRFRGLITSGGSRAFTKDGDLDPMVTDVPGVIKASNPDCVALGTVPRVDYLRLVGESRLVLDGYGQAVNPTMSAVLIVQNGADGKGEWDGDLDALFELYDNLVGVAKFERAGFVAWNGGPITEDEIKRSARRGWPTIVVKGSGRVADEVAAKIEAGDVASIMGDSRKTPKLVVAHRDDPGTLRQALGANGFLANANR